VSVSDFRQITVKGEAPKGERLFRAAVSAFCSLTRPSRRDIAQLEDLTLPLFDCVSVESRRYVAAALSECAYPPGALVKRLCDEPVEIAAPLIIRSNALSDIDLIALIGRHGHGHARAIARRPNLNPTIARLIAALDRKAAAASAHPAGVDSAIGDATATAIVDQPAVEAETSFASGEAAENARRRLRSMMLPAEPVEGTRINPIVGPSAYARLRDTALSGHAAFFHTALADALGVDFAAIRQMSRSPSYDWLLAGFRALDLNDEQAFLITAAVAPSELKRPESVRLFLSRYRLVDREIALHRVRSWKAEAIVAAIGAKAPERPAASHAAPALDFVSDPWIRAKA
jgi:uncharacterized protein (DUF2336 family)